MKLRGHHVFCTALFSGHGYDEAFTENMSGLIEAWKAGEEAELTEGRDALCAACPNRLEDGGCALGTEDVSRRDRAALRVLGLAGGERLSWKGAGERLLPIGEEEFQQVCGGCRWQREGLCSLEQLKRSVKGG